MSPERKALAIETGRECAENLFRHAPKDPAEWFSKPLPLPSHWDRMRLTSALGACWPQETREFEVSFRAHLRALIHGRIAPKGNTHV